MQSILQRYRKWLILGLLASAVLTSLTVAFVLRFDFAVPAEHQRRAFSALAVAFFVKMLVFYLCDLHRGWWAWTDTRDMLKIIKVNLLASVAFTGAMLGIYGWRFPRSIYVLDFLICLMFIGGLRMTARLAKELTAGLPRESDGKDVLIYGAGWAGASLAREMRMNPEYKYRVAGFIDDDAHKKGEWISGHQVLGPGAQLAQILDRLQVKGHRPDEVIISMPSATGRQVREAVAECRAAGIKCRILPGLPSLLVKQGLTSQVRDIALEDLLGREAVVLDKALITEKLVGRSVLVTGAAGSIGSVLCQQIASFRPASLVLFDQAESEVFRVEAELKGRYPEVGIVPAIGDIRDAADVEAALKSHRVSVVFHAAAYKHVPMMEHHVLAAARNNVLGTWNVARAAYNHGVDSFVMISSDKAVNPANIMGATKRAAELLVSSFNHGAARRTRFVSVRFGNVLGSSGSVVPTFRRQIAAGGPVTVTHPEVRRYFMLTEEAVQLVLQASTMGNRGEIFVLDMGELVKISDLAANMIRLAGFRPDEDIEIRYSGLRPGEKLYEEVISQGERVVPTNHERIKVFLGDPLDPPVAREWVERLRHAVAARNETQAVRLLMEIVPEFEPSGEWKARLQQEAAFPAGVSSQPGRRAAHGRGFPAQWSELV